MIGTPSSPFYSPRASRGGESAPNPSAQSNVPILITAFLAILATGGPTYSFGVYAATLKDNLSLTQSQVDTLGAASFAAGFISWVPGLFVDGWGSQLALIIGGLLQSFGLLSYWVVARYAYTILPPNSWVPILSSLSMLIFTANNLVIGGVFKAIVVSCGLGTKGKAVGAAKAYLGLGAGVFSSLFHAAWPTSGTDDNSQGRSDLDFLAMSSVCAILAIVIPALLALPTKAVMEKDGTKDDSTNLHYNVVYGGLGVLCVVVVGSSVVTLFQPDGTESSSPLASSFTPPDWVSSLVVLSAWAGPVVGLWWVPSKISHRKQYHKSHSRIRQNMRRALEKHHSNEGMCLLPPSKSISLSVNNTTSISTMNSLGSDETEELEDIVCETPQPVMDRTLVEMLQTSTAWIFLSVCTLLVGSGTMLTINMGQMVQSLDFAPETVLACLAIFSVAQATARVLSGAVSESALQWKTRVFGVQGVPRPAFLVLSCVLAVLGHTVLAFSSADLPLFAIGIVLTGTSFGALWPLMVLIVGDLFGTVNHGANYMFADGFTCAVGTLSIAKFLTQLVYENHVDESETSCFGDGCFHTTHLIIASLCLVAVFASTYLLYTTRASYGSVLS